jgi:hypothetical protein
VQPERARTSTAGATLVGAQVIVLLFLPRHGCYALAVDGVALVQVETEQAVIAEARALRTTGLSLRKVAEELDSKGLRARNGRTFAPAQVARMVAA